MVRNIFHIIACFLFGAALAKLALNGGTEEGTSWAALACAASLIASYIQREHQL